MRTSDNRHLVYLDACIFTAKGRRHDENYSEEEVSGCVECIDRIENGQWAGVASVVLKLELLQASSRDFLKLFDSRKGQFVNVYPTIVDHAIKFRELNLGSMDAIHLATAMVSKCTYFVTLDGRNTKKNDKKKILTHARRIESEFGLHVVSPISFQPTPEPQPVLIAADSDDPM